MFIREFFELVKLNILFFISCIPIITLPASRAAMNRIIVAMVQDQNHYLWYDFQKSFRREFIRSLAVGWPLYLSKAGCVCLAVWGYVMGKTSAFYWLFTLLFLLIFLLLGLLQCYLFPLLAAVDITTGQAIKNSLLLVFTCFFRSVLALFLSGSIWLIWLVFLTRSMPWAFILLFAVSDLISVFCVWDDIKKHIIREN